MANDNINPDHVTKASIINGGIVLYDKCTKDRFLSDPTGWEYIGFGTVFSVDDQPSTITTRFHFWKRRS